MNPQINPHIDSKISTTIRVVLIGDTDVGKSTLCQAMKGSLPPDELVKPSSTVGAEFSTTITHNHVRLELWDTAGQERYRALVPLYFRQADIFLLLFDVSQRTSFNSIDGWIQLIEQHKDSVDNKNNSADVKPFPIILVANKIDLRPDKSQTSQNSQNNDRFKPRSYYVHDIEATNKAQQYQMPLFCTSATKGIGMDKLKQTLETYAYPIPRDSNTSDILQLGSFGNRNCSLAGSLPGNICKM